MTLDFFLLADSGEGSFQHELESLLQVTDSESQCLLRGSSNKF